MYNFMKNGHIAKVVAGKGNGIQKTQRIGNLLTNIQKLNQEKAIQAQQIRNMQNYRNNVINKITELSLGEKELPIYNDYINITESVYQPVVIEHVVKPVIKPVVFEPVINPVINIVEPVDNNSKPTSIIGKIFKANKDRQKTVTISDSV